MSERWGFRLSASWWESEHLKVGAGTPTGGEGLRWEWLLGGGCEIRMNKRNAHADQGRP